MANAGRSRIPSDVARPVPDDLLTVTEAARIARRSVRTLRRAYRGGALAAYRDGNGRTVRIQYADLRDWMRAETVASRHGDSAPPNILVPRPAVRSKSRAEENLRLLQIARDRRDRAARR